MIESLSSILLMSNMSSDLTVETFVLASVRLLNVLRDPRRSSLDVSL